MWFFFSANHKKSPEGIFTIFRHTHIAYSWFIGYPVICPYCVISPYYVWSHYHHIKLSEVKCHILWCPRVVGPTRTGLCSSMLAAAESVICRVKEAPHMRYLDGRLLWKNPLRSMKWENFFIWHMALWEWEIMALWTPAMAHLWHIHGILILAKTLSGPNPIIIRSQASGGSQQAYRLCLRRQIGSRIRIHPIERDRHHIMISYGINVWLCSLCGKKK